MLALTVTDTQCQWGQEALVIFKLVVFFSCSIEYYGAFSTGVVIVMQVLWFRIRIRSDLKLSAGYGTDAEPENIPD